MQINKTPAPTPANKGPVAPPKVGELKPIESKASGSPAPKQPRFMRYDPPRLRESIERNTRRRAALMERIAKIDAKIAVRQKRLADITKH